MEKNKLMMIIIIVLLVVLLITIGGVSFYAFRLLGDQKKAEADKNSDPSQLTVEQTTTVDMSEALVGNLLKGADGKEHVIKIGVGIVVNNTDKKESPKIIALIQANETLTKDVVQSVIRGKTYQEMSRPDAKDVVAAELKTKFQEEYKSNLIVGVAFFEFFAQ